MHERYPFSLSKTKLIILVFLLTVLLIGLNFVQFSLSRNGVQPLFCLIVAVNSFLYLLIDYIVCWYYRNQWPIWDVQLDFSPKQPDFGGILGISLIMSVYTALLMLYTDDSAIMIVVIILWAMPLAIFMWLTKRIGESVTRSDIIELRKVSLRDDYGAKGNVARWSSFIVRVRQEIASHRGEKLLVRIERCQHDDNGHLIPGRSTVCRVTFPAKAKARRWRLSLNSVLSEMLLAGEEESVYVQVLDKDGEELFFDIFGPGESDFRPDR